MNADKVLYRNVFLEELVKMKQSTVKRFVSKWLNKTGYEVIEEDGFVFAKGTFPVLLVAHMDTVHKETVKKIKYNGASITSPQGIGGDDRCGIYIILELIKTFNCSVLFTEDEEKGCVGAEKFAKSIYPKECDVNYIVEFDRRGNRDAVFYRCNNPEFEEFVESTGYFKTAWGTCSDIVDVAPAVGVAAVNLSSGYYSEHTKLESINLLDLKYIIDEAKKLLTVAVDGPFEYIERKYSNWNSWYDYETDNDFDWEEEYTRYKGSNNDIAISKTRQMKYVYHIYLISYSEELICLEVFAASKMEAIGIALTSYPFYTANDIYDILGGPSTKETPKIAAAD